ncbi:MAG: diguanylate cyclase domain-containing protein [Bacillota bacterium]
MSYEKFIEILDKKLYFGSIILKVKTFLIFIYSVLLVFLSFIFSPPLTGILTLLLVISVNLLWGRKKGLIISLLATGILIISILTYDIVANYIYVILTISMYFLISLVIGSFIDIIQKQNKILKESKKKYRFLTEKASAILWEYDVIEDKWTYVAPQVKELLGYDPDEWNNLNFWKENIHPQDREWAANYCMECTANGKEHTFEYRFFKKNGELIWLRDEVSVEINNDKPVKLTGLMVDITKLKQTQKKLKKLSEEQSLLLNNIEVQIWYLNSPEIHGKVNKARAKFMGFSKEEIENSNYYDLYTNKEDAERCVERNKKVFEEKKKIHSEGEVTNGKGKIRILSVIKIPKLDKKGNVEYVICSAIDITEQKKKEEKIKYIGFHDTLTDLYNRTFMEEELQRLNVERQLPISVIMADVNGLKLVNDSYGHDTGDQLLIKAAEILKNSCREEDIIARWGGDEFVIIFPQTSKKEVKKIYNRIKAGCSNEKIDGKIPISIALGLAVKNNTSTNIYQIIQKAEDRMYDNKRTESKSAKSHILTALLKTMEEKSNETKEHAVRMQKMAKSLGKKLDLSPSEMDKLSLLAALHDIGKVTISKKILNKKEDLVKEEWETIKKHPEVASHIIAATKEFGHISEEISAHHEHWDGSGYPNGLEGKEIPYLARIISIIDAYDVMTNDRPYKKTLSKKQALKEIERCAGSQFDPELANEFIKLIRNMD